jgi:hypothetical protein
MGTANARVPDRISEQKAPMRGVNRTRKSGERWRGMLLHRIGDAVIESRSKGAAVDENVSPLCVRVIGQIDLRIGSAPRILLTEAPYHLPGDALKGPELLFEVGEDLFVPIVALIADGHTGKLIIDRQEADAVDRDPGIRRCAVPRLEFVHMRACPGDFQVRPCRQGGTPGQALKTVRVVHHRHRMGEKGAAHAEQESQQEKVSARVIPLPSDHARTLPWWIAWRNSLGFVENVLRHSL